MKATLILSFIVALICICSAKQVDDTSVKKTYASSFFIEKINASRILKKRYQGKYICHPSKLDTILSGNNYELSRGYLSPTYKNDKDSVIIFWITNNKEILGLNEYKKANSYKNNILVVFEKRNNIYTMCDFFYKPVNQGTFSLANMEIISEKKSLKLIQYGGSQLGYWYTEFMFEYDGYIKQWILDKYSLHTAIWGQQYTKNKLIWTKKPPQKTTIDHVYFSYFFTDNDLDSIEN